MYIETNLRSNVLITQMMLRSLISAAFIFSDVEET